MVEYSLLRNQKVITRKKKITRSLYFYVLEEHQQLVIQNNVDFSLHTAFPTVMDSYCLQYPNFLNKKKSTHLKW